MKTAKKAKKKMRPGERVGTFARLGRATPFGIASLMQGATVARGDFVPARETKRKKRKTKRAKAGA